MMLRAVTTTHQNTLIAVLVAFCGAMNLSILAIAILRPFALNSDFMAFWSFPRFIAGHAPGEIYNAAALQPFQAALYPGFHSFYPYLYPPTLLMVTGWLGHFGFAAAETIWTVAGLALFIPAAFAFFGRRGWMVVVALLASPAALLNGVTGETAFFTSALLLAGFAALRRWPALAGIAFGLLTLKPQLGVLIPFLLLARGDWTAILTAMLTAGALIAASCLVFPPAMWGIWAHTLPAYQADYFTGGGLNLNIIVTPAANLVALGAPVGVAWGVQLLCSAAVVAAVIIVTRSGPYGLAVAALLTGSFIAVPHAYAYDSITLTAAMALMLRARILTPLWQVIFGAAIYLGPLLLLTRDSRWFLYALPETILFGGIIALALAGSNGAISSDATRPSPAT
jgi:hypothetical protein